MKLFPTLDARDVEAPSQRSIRWQIVLLVLSAALAACASGQRHGHPWSGHFAAVKGRLVDEVGQSAGGLQVTLAALHSEAFLPPAHSAFEGRRVHTEQAVTDAEGRFHFRRLPGRAIVGIGVSFDRTAEGDRPGERASWTMLETSPEWGRTVDLGELVLTEFVASAPILCEEEGRQVIATLGPLAESEVGVDLGFISMKFATDEELRVQPMTIRVEDEKGELVSGATIGFEARKVPGTIGGFAAHLATQRAYQAAEIEPGVYRASVPAGAWIVTVQAADLASTGRFLEHTAEGGAEHLIVCCRGEPRTLTARDSQGAPVSNVHVVMFRIKNRTQYRVVASGWTNARGEVSLGPVGPIEVAEPRFPSGDVVFDVVSIDHYDYAPSSWIWPRTSEQDSVVLFEPHTLRGRVTWAGAPPQERYTVTLGRHGRSRLGPSMARIVQTDSDGNFEVEGLARGTYTIAVTRFAHAGASVYLPGRKRFARIVGVKSHSVGPSIESTVEIDLSASGEAAPGHLEGLVLLDGEPVPNTTVWIQDEMEVETLTSDERGRFLSKDYPAWKRLDVRAALRPDDRIDQEPNSLPELVRLSLFAGASRVTVDMSTLPLKISVFDAETGAPIPGASFSAVDGDSSLSKRLADDDGILLTTAMCGGHHVVLQADADGYSFEERAVLARGRTRPTVIEFRLWRIVEKRGTVTMRTAPVWEPRGRRVAVAPVGASPAQSRRVWLGADGPTVTIRLDDFEPGRYVARFVTDGEWFVSEPFLVPEGPTESIHVCFED